MTRRGWVASAAAALVVLIAGGLEAAPADARKVRASASTTRTDLGLTAAITASGDGGVVLEASLPDLTFRKVVYPDGRFIVHLTQGNDQLSLAGDFDGIQVTRKGASLKVRPAQDNDKHGQRVREWVAASKAARKFRQLTAALESDEAFDAVAVGLRVTGAVLAELEGDTAAAQRFSRQLVGRIAPRVRKANSTYPPSCWDQYKYLVLGAANELQECYSSFYTWNPMRQLCSFVWSIQVEAAWFGLLGCSAVPLPR